MTYHIYILKHPETLEIFYVGGTSKPLEREKSHMLNYSRTKGFTPIFEVIEMVEGTATEAICREWEVIQEYAKSHPLQQDTKTRRPGNVRRREIMCDRIAKIQQIQREKAYQFYTYRDVSEMYGVSLTTISNLLEEKQIKPYQIGKRSFRLRTDQIEKLFAL